MPHHLVSGFRTWASTTGSLPSPSSWQIRDPWVFPLFQLTDHLRFGKLKSYPWGSKWDVVVSELQREVLELSLTFGSTVARRDKDNNQKGS